MKFKNTPHAYGIISRSLHWLMVLLLALMFAIGWGADYLSGDSKSAAIDLHKSVGITILALAAMRLLWRILNPPPPPPAGLKPLERLAASLTHMALYVMLFAMPVIGWAMVSAFGRKVDVFNVVQLPNLVEKDRHMGGLFKDLHETGGNALAILIGAHVAAALYHHFIRKDNVLRRMWKG